jgi:hypothetical protein
MRAFFGRAQIRALSRRYPCAVRLEKFQKNAIFQEIVAGGLDPSECDLTQGAAEVRISHVPSGSVFILGGDARRYTGSYVVGDSALSWPYVAQHILAMALHGLDHLFGGGGRRPQLPRMT